MDTGQPLVSLASGAGEEGEQHFSDKISDRQHVNLILAADEARQGESAYVCCSGNCQGNLEEVSFSEKEYHVVLCVNKRTTQLKPWRCAGRHRGSRQAVATNTACREDKVISNDAHIQPNADLTFALVLALAATEQHRQQKTIHS